MSDTQSSDIRILVRKEKKQTQYISNLHLLLVFDSERRGNQLAHIDRHGVCCKPYFGHLVCFPI